MRNRIGLIGAFVIALTAVSGPGTGSAAGKSFVSSIDGEVLGPGIDYPMVVDRDGRVHVAAFSYDHLRYLLRKPGATKFTGTANTDYGTDPSSLHLVRTTSGAAIDLIVDTCHGVKARKIPRTQRKLGTPSSAHIAVPIACHHPQNYEEWWHLNHHQMTSLDGGKVAILFSVDPSNRSHHLSTVYVGKPGNTFHRTVLPGIGSEENIAITQDPADNALYVAAITTKNPYSEAPDFTLHLFAYDAAARKWHDSSTPLHTGDPYAHLGSMAASHGQIWITVAGYPPDPGTDVGNDITLLHRNVDGTWDDLAHLPDDNGAHYVETTALAASPNADAADVWLVNDTNNGIVRREFTEATGWSQPVNVTHGHEKVDVISTSWNGPPVVEYSPHACYSVFGSCVQP